MRLQAWSMLLGVCLCCDLLVHSSAARRNAQQTRLRKWIRRCSCPCLVNTTILANCIRRETFTIDESKQLNLHSTANFSTKFTRVEQKQLSCQLRPGQRRNRLNYFLLNLRCNGKRRYVIYRRPFTRSNTNLQNTLSADSLVNSYRSTTLRSNQEEKQQGNSKTQNRLVIGLSIGVGLMVAIIVFWTWIRCRRRRTKRKADKKEQTPDFGYIDEEEDSAPYRIVDLQTNISSDASGYTFLEARKPEEEHQYMKLQPICKRIQNKEGTEDVTQSAFEEIVDDEDDERPYETLLPTSDIDDNKDCVEETKEFEEIADDPVYFMLEGKEKSSIS